MMILSALMKMLLWTLPGSTLQTQDMAHKESVYAFLQNDLAELKSNLAQEETLNCDEIYVQSSFQLLTEQFLLSISKSQQPEAVESANALAKVLSDAPTDASDYIRTLLRGFLLVNPVLSEAAYVVPALALPEASREGKNEHVLIVHVASRNLTTGDKASTDREVDINTLTLTGWEARYLALKVIQDLIRTAAGARMKTSDKTASYGNMRPLALLEKHCSAVDGDKTNVASRDPTRRRKEWRIMLGFLTRQVTKDAVAAPVFYVTLPVRNVDLNQCDDSPLPVLRGTHSCLNNTTCIFSPGGGFEIGHYKCCCQPKNISTISATTFSWLEQQHQHHQLFALQKHDQCFDGKLVEDERLHRRPFPGQCTAYFEGDYTLRKVLLAVNVICAMGAFALIFVVMTQRKVQAWGSRGWALMELFLLGAILLYSIVILEFLQPQTSICCLVVWCRELGFALFYGTAVLKIYRNLFEHRVRKAHHVYIKEKDLLKYLLCIVAFTVIGLVAWTITAIQAAQANQPTTNGEFPSSVALLSSGRTKSGSPYVVCTFFHWNLVWHFIEFALLAYGVYLSYKARNTTWNERRQFSFAVLVEIAVSLALVILRNSIWLESSPDTLLLLSFIQVHLTVTIITTIIMATKFYYASLDPSARAHSVISSGPNKPHPSLAKLRDNLVNGTVDFAEVPIAEMNPEDIRAELKRVYTQLRMYKLSNLYMENPHITKRKGGKKTSSKQANRRFSIPTVPNKPQNKELKRLEADERSSLAKGGEDDNASVGSGADLTIESSPHNVYLSRTALAAAKKLQLDSDLSVRI